MSTVADSSPDTPAAAAGAGAGAGQRWRGGRARGGGGPEVAAAVLTAGPVLVDLATGGVERRFAYPAADAFYYLQVSRTWASTGHIAFDGRRATNGFHPLWQAMETGLQWGGDRLGVGPTGMLLVVLVVQAVGLAAAVLLLGRVLRRARGGSLGGWFAAVPLGVYGLAIAPLWVAAGATGARGVNPLEGHMPLYGSLWSDVNGMETPLAVGLFVLLLWWGTRPGPMSTRRAAVFGLLAGLVVLARLDLGLVVAPVLGLPLLLALARRDRAAVRRALVSIAVTGALLGLYLAWNLWYCGVLLPVSGSAKTTFPRPTLGNWRDAVSYARGQHALGTLRLYRQLPVFVPGVLALVHVVVTGPGTLRSARVDPPPDDAGDDDVDVARRRLRLLVLGTAIGVFVLGLYDLLFVPSNFQGHWYWPVSTLYPTLLLAEVLDRWRLRHPASEPRNASAAPAARRRTAAAAMAPAAALSVVAFVWLNHPADYHRRFAQFDRRIAPAIREHYRGRSLKVLAIDDGIDAWSLRVPAMSGTGLMLDPPAERAFERGRLLDVALARGFDRISSVQYLDATGLTPTTPSATIAAHLAGVLPHERLTEYRFRVEYRSRPFFTSIPGSDGRYVLIRFWRATGPQPAARSR